MVVVLLVVIATLVGHLLFLLFFPFLAEMRALRRVLSAVMMDRDMLAMILLFEMVDEGWTGGPFFVDLRIWNFVSPSVAWAKQKQATTKRPKLAAKIWESNESVCCF